VKIYLDENVAGRELTARLARDDHAVAGPADAGLLGASDADQFVHAIEGGLTVVTKDTEDFEGLHRVVIASGGEHPGILLVRRQNDPTRDMTARGIATAINKLQASGAPLANQVHILNQWR